MATATVNFQQPFPLDFFDENRALFTLVEGNEFELDLKKLPREQVLLRWVNRLLQHAADHNPKELIRNFGNDMRNPLVFYQLLRQLNPEILPELPNENTNPLEIARIVLEVVRDSLGVETTYQPEDLCGGDAMINCTFISQIFNVEPGSAVLWKIKYDKLVEGKDNIFPSYEDFGSLEWKDMEDFVTKHFPSDITKKMGVFGTIWTEHARKKKSAEGRVEIFNPLDEREDEFSEFTGSAVEESIEARHIGIIEKRRKDISLFNENHDRNKKKMNQTTTTADTQPVDLEVLRLKLEENGKVYCNNLFSEQARERLLQTLQTNDCREILTAVKVGDDLANAFARAGSKNHVDVLEVFLNHGMNINIQDEDGWTALMHASSSGQEESVRFLLDHHGKVNIQDKYGMTALIYASQYGKTKIVQMLLEKNANPKIQNNFGLTALMFASLKGNKEVVQLLLIHGADIELTGNNDGKTALDVANDEEIKDLLRNHVSSTNKQQVLAEKKEIDPNVNHVNKDSLSISLENQQLNEVKSTNYHLQSFRAFLVVLLLAFSSFVGYFLITNKLTVAEMTRLREYILSEDRFKSENCGESFHDFKLAADQGYVHAPYALGVCYEKGQGVTKDEAEAAKYFKMAADNGHSTAKFTVTEKVDNSIDSSRTKGECREIEVARWEERSERYGAKCGAFKAFGGRKWADVWMNVKVRKECRSEFIKNNGEHHSYSEWTDSGETVRQENKRTEYMC